MNDFYSPPKTNLTEQIAERSSVRSIVFVAVNLLFSWLFVSYASIAIAELIVPQKSDIGEYRFYFWTNLLDLIFSFLVLVGSGYLISKMVKDSRVILSVTIVATLFTINSVRIVTFEHLMEITCDFYWYDSLIVLKNPIGYFAGYFVYLRATKI